MYDIYSDTYEDYLMHHGVKGMKWGVRKKNDISRYRNSDGSLTKAGIKKSKKYRSLMGKVGAGVRSRNNDVYIDSYNRTNHKFNGELTEKYENNWRKKHGNDYKNPDYVAKYDKYFEKVFAQEFTVSKLESMVNSKSYKKAVDFAKKYEMESWDSLAKKNQKNMRNLNKKLYNYEYDYSIDD